MSFLFETKVDIGGKLVTYKVCLHSRGAYYAESMNPDYDNFLLKKRNNEWETSLIRNRQSAIEIGELIDSQGL